MIHYWRKESGESVESSCTINQENAWAEVGADCSAVGDVNEYSVICSSFGCREDFRCKQSAVPTITFMVAFTILMLHRSLQADMLQDCVPGVDYTLSPHGAPSQSPTKPYPDSAAFSPLDSLRAPSGLAAGYNQLLQRRAIRRLSQQHASLRGSGHDINALAGGITVGSGMMSTREALNKQLQQTRQQKTLKGLMQQVWCGVM